MASDLIYREDAKDFVRHAYNKGLNPVKYLDEVPAADVRPVVHGEWKNAHPSSPLLDGGGPPYCSVCGKEAPLRSVEVNQWKLERGSLSGPEVVYKTKCFLSNFCPNCGADMREPQMLKNASQNADADVMMPAT